MKKSLRVWAFPVLPARLEQRKSDSRRNEVTAMRKIVREHMFKQLLALGSALYYYQWINDRGWSRLDPITLYRILP